MYMKRLIDNLEQLNQIFHALANGITVQDSKGRLLFVNQKAAEMMNCKTPEDAIAKGGLEIVKDFKFFSENGKLLEVTDLPGRLALQGIHESEMIVRYASDKFPKMRWTSIKAAPIFDTSGKVVLVVNVLQDITELKGAESRLKEANKRITKLLEDVLTKDIGLNSSR